MKAIRVHQFGPPDVLKLEETPDLVPGKGQVVVEIKAAGVNPVDTYLRAGQYAAKPSLPYTPGMDGAGTIIAVGPDVARVRRGDRVYLANSLSGTYAEQALCSEDQVHPLPTVLSFSQGAAIHVAYATAYAAIVERAQAVLGETILIHGASGGVGVAAVQIARASGLRVIGTASTEKGRSLIRQEGAHEAFDHSASDYIETILKTVGTVQIIIEMAAHKNLAEDFKMLARNGRIVIVGSRGPVQIDPRDILSRDAVIRGMALMNASPAQLRQIHERLADGFNQGALRPVVGEEISLADASLAHQKIMESGAHGKLVLIP